MPYQVTPGMSGIHEFASSVVLLAAHGSLKMGSFIYGFMVYIFHVNSVALWHCVMAVTMDMHY